MNKHIQTDLKYRVINREGDEDYFIETESYPINLDLDSCYMSRLQFPISRALLIRTSPKTDWITIHILQDTDLYSSCANFEMNLQNKKLTIAIKEGYMYLEVSTLLESSWL